MIAILMPVINQTVPINSETGVSSLDTRGLKILAQPAIEVKNAAAGGVLSGRLCPKT